MKKEFIIYQGEKYVLEWYFDDRGRSLVLEYFEELSVERKKKAFKLFRAMADAGKIFNVEKFNNEGDKIYAFKPAPDRFLCFFFEGSKIVVTNAFEKKTAKLPAKEKDRALRCKSDYLVRVSKGNYYD